MSFTRNSKLRAVLLGGASWLAAGAVQAQTPPAAGSEPTAIDDVVVTGSRIRRDTIDTPTPVVTLGSEDLRESGDTELSETLADLPALSSTINDSTVAGNVQNSGLSSIQLRNLGDNRTLVLVDGRRAVSNSANGNRVSLSTIPSDFVDRVEVITGGASSVYGSDAVAGVVNIITESSQTGLRLNARAGVTEEGDGEETTYNLTWGNRFNERRGYFLVSGTYDRDGGVRAVDRDWAIRGVDYDYDEAAGINEIDTIYVNEDGEPTSGNQPANLVTPAGYLDRSGATPGGVFYGGSSSRDRFYIGQTLVPLGPDVQTGGTVNVGTRDDGNTGYFLPNRDGYNQREGRSLILPRERYLLAMKADYDLSDNVSLFGQIQYSQVETEEVREPIGIAHDTTYQIIDQATGEFSEHDFGRIACRRETGSSAGPCNPFVPDEIRRDVSTSGAGVGWERRFVEVGDRITENDRRTVRSWAGLRGDLSSGWQWEASVGYGRYEQDQVRRNQVNAVNLIQGLDATVVNGEIVCSDPSDGCVPVNLFGEGSITPEAADFIRADLEQNATIEQTNFQAFASGDLWQLPAGPVGAAFGVEYRKDSMNLTGNLLQQFGGTTDNMVPNYSGSISVKEAFGEVSVPLLRDRPGFELLSLDASVRVADYDIENVGTVFSYRAGLQWAPVSDLRFRAQFARAQRAPDLTELYSPPRGDFDSVSDLCDGVTPISTGRIAANCLAEPGVQAAFAEMAAEGDPLVFEQSGSGIYSPNAGNLDLEEETADTITIGAVLQPRFLSGLTLAVDWYDIQIEDAITAYGNQEILVECYDSDLAVADNPFCADVSRNPNTGQISEVLQRQFNLAGYRTSGVDVAVQYRFDLEDRFGVPGQWDLRYDGTHITRQENSFEGLTGLVVTDQKGDLSAGSFEYRGRASLRWSHDNLRLRWTTTYLGDILDSRFRLEQYEQLLQTVPDAEFPMFLAIDGVFEHDIYAAYDFAVSGTEVRLYGGVKNVFNDISPFLPTGDVFSGRLTNYNNAYDTAGRRFYIGLTVDF